MPGACSFLIHQIEGISRKGVEVSGLLLAVQLAANTIARPCAGQCLAEGLLSERRGLDPEARAGWAEAGHQGMPGSRSYLT